MEEGPTVAALRRVVETELSTKCPAGWKAALGDTRRAKRATCENFTMVFKNYSQSNRKMVERAN